MLYNGWLGSDLYKTNRSFTLLYSCRITTAAALEIICNALLILVGIIFFAHFLACNSTIVLARLKVTTKH